MESDSKIENLQRLYDYLTNISSDILSYNKDIVYSFLCKDGNKRLIEQFCEDQKERLLCLTKIVHLESSTTEKVEETSENTELTLDLVVKYREGTNTSVYLLKKPNIFDINGSIANQLQVMTLSSEGEAFNIFSNMQLVIANTISPYFKDYLEIQGGEQGGRVLSNSVSQFNIRMNEMLFLLQQAQVNSEIPNIKLSVLPEINTYIEKMKKEDKC